MFFHFLAMSQPSGEGGGGGMGIIGFLPWIAIILVIYFLMIRPQAKKQKQQQEMLKGLLKGDKVVTSGGIHGEIVGLKDNQNILIVKIAKDVKIEVERASIGRLVSRGGSGTDN